MIMTHCLKSYLRTNVTLSSLPHDDSTSTAGSESKKQCSFPCDTKSYTCEGRNKIFYVKTFSQTSNCNENN